MTQSCVIPNKWPEQIFGNHVITRLEGPKTQGYILWKLLWWYRNSRETSPPPRRLCSLGKKWITKAGVHDWNTQYLPLHKIFTASKVKLMFGYLIWLTWIRHFIEKCWNRHYIILESMRLLLTHSEPTYITCNYTIYLIRSVCPDEHRQEAWQWSRRSPWYHRRPTCSDEDPGFFF